MWLAAVHKERYWFPHPNPGPDLTPILTYVNPSNPHPNPNPLLCRILHLQIRNLAICLCELTLELIRRIHRRCSLQGSDSRTRDETLIYIISLIYISLQGSDSRTRDPTTNPNPGGSCDDGDSGFSSAAVVLTYGCGGAMRIGCGGAMQGVCLDLLSLFFYPHAGPHREKCTKGVGWPHA